MSPAPLSCIDVDNLANFKSPTAGRVIAGIGAGILAVVVPMYQGEVATAETRGAMMAVTGIM
jgi:MFS family permease